MKSVYIHIPFCQTICSYCDFCKMFYNKKLVNEFLNALEVEVNNSYNNEIIQTIYIGGGTPSALNIEELIKLFQIIDKFKLDKNVEFTFECNIENINEEKLQLLFDNNVNRLSIGVQTFNKNHLKFLERNHKEENVIKTLEIAKKIGFKNINIDLMYAFENQTLDEVKEDLELFLKLDVPHISTYSLIIEPNTKLYIKNTENIDQDLDYEMYSLINKILKKNNYIHYETSNYSKYGYESKHNLTYWNNEEYYGFGLGASGFINNERYTNTKSIIKYNKHQFINETDKMDVRTNMENEMILGLRKTEGVNKKQFFDKYKLNISDVFNIENLLKEKKLLENEQYIWINEDYIYLSNTILRNFLK